MNYFKIRNSFIQTLSQIKQNHDFIQVLRWQITNEPINQLLCGSGLLHYEVKSLNQGSK